MLIGAMSTTSPSRFRVIRPMSRLRTWHAAAARAAPPVAAPVRVAAATKGRFAKLRLGAAGGAALGTAAEQAVDDERARLLVEGDLLDQDAAREGPVQGGAAPDRPGPAGDARDEQPLAVAPRRRRVRGRGQEAAEREHGAGREQGALREQVST
jgi:hypothetical protein